MKNLFKSPLTLFVLIIFLAACSKEKQLQNRLTRKNGTWEIVSWEAENYNNSGSLIASFIAGNIGTLEFQKDGTLIWVSSLLSSGPGRWYVSGSDLVLSANSNSNVLKYKVLKNSPKEMIITADEIWGSGLTRRTLTLRR